MIGPKVVRFVEFSVSVSDGCKIFGLGFRTDHKETKFSVSVSDGPKNRSVRQKTVFGFGPMWSAAALLITSCIKTKNLLKIDCK